LYALTRSHRLQKYSVAHIRRTRLHTPAHGS
jgi:hypothetical protein